MNTDIPRAAFPAGGTRRKDAPAEPIDPRVRLAAGDPGEPPRVRGIRCTACRHPVAEVLPRCPACRAPVVEAAFGPGGVVWSSTVVRVPVPGRTAPFGLAYVDLDEGPRVLLHTEGPAAHAFPVGARVRIRGTSDTGDVEAELEKREAVP